MLFVTGDIHNSISIGRLNTKNFPEQKNLTKDDHIIICGDFGFPWSIGESKEDSYWLNWLDKKNFTTLFVPGNHENYDALKEYETVIYKNARCKKLRNSVLMIEHGEIIKIDNKNIFCFGGANSYDKEYRKEFVSWWREEIPSYNKINYAISNFKKHKEEIDIIITHEGPAYAVTELGKSPDSFSKVLENFTSNKLWFFGHHHTDRQIDSHTTAVYTKIIEID